MGEFRVRCPQCHVGLKLAKMPEGTDTIKCPKCQSAIPLASATSADTGGGSGTHPKARSENPKSTRPASGRASSEEPERRKRSSKPDGERPSGKTRKRRAKAGSDNLVLWLSVGGGVVVLAAVILVLMLPRSDNNKEVAKNEPPPNLILSNATAGQYFAGERKWVASMVIRAEPMFNAPLVRNIPEFKNAADAAKRLGPDGQLSPQNLEMFAFYVDEKSAAAAVGWREPVDIQRLTDMMRKGPQQFGRPGASAFPPGHPLNTMPATNTPPGDEVPVLQEQYKGVPIYRLTPSSSPMAFFGCMPHGRLAVLGSDLQELKQNLERMNGNTSATSWDQAQDILQLQIYDLARYKELATLMEQFRNSELLSRGMPGIVPPKAAAVEVPPWVNQLVAGELTLRATDKLELVIGTTAKDEASAKTATDELNKLKGLLSSIVGIQRITGGIPAGSPQDQIVTDLLKQGFVQQGPRVQLSLAVSTESLAALAANPMGTPAGKKRPAPTLKPSSKPSLGTPPQRNTPKLNYPTGATFAPQRFPSYLPCVLTSSWAEALKLRTPWPARSAGQGKTVLFC